jgi:hypothetical protein
MEEKRRYTLQELHRRTFNSRRPMTPIPGKAD